MADVIRDAIVRLRLEQQKAKLEAPDVEPAVRAHEKEKKAIEETAKAKKESERATKELGRVSAVTSQQTLNGFREAGEGVFRFGRGLALLSADGSEDLEHLIQKVAKAQAAFDLFAGSSKVFTSLTGVIGGPLSGAIVGVTGLLTAGGLAWARWQREAEAAIKAASQEMKRYRSEVAETEAAQLQHARKLADIRKAAALTERESQRRETLERERLAAEFPGLESRARGTLIGGALRQRQERGPLGSPSEIPILRDAAENRPDLLRLQAQLERDLSDALSSRIRFEKEENQRIVQRAQAETLLTQSFFDIGSATAGVAGSAVIQAGATPVNQQAARREAETTERLQRFVDDIVNAFERAGERIDRIERSLNIANPE